MQVGGGREAAEAAAAGGCSSLDRATKLPSGDLGVRLIVYPKSQEFVVCQEVPRRLKYRVKEFVDTDRAEREASRRARTMLRRYCTQHQLSYLWTLTYAGGRQSDRRAITRHLERLLAKVRDNLGVKAFPYARVFEWHKSGLGLHVHMAVPMWYPQPDLERQWGRGFVFCSGNRMHRRNEGRHTASYLSKYMGKAFEATDRGDHRYECAQGFPIERYTLKLSNFDDAIDLGLKFFRSPVAFVWDSREDPESMMPPTLVALFNAPASGLVWETTLAELESHELQ